MSSNQFAKRIRYSLRWLPDVPYIQLNYFAHFHRFANLRNPVTYNEKINYLKLHDRNSLYTKMVDKYEVKKIVSDIIGNEYVIPTLGIWERYDDIDFDLLPKQFVLKCTHDSEGVVIVKDKTNFDSKATKRKIERLLRQNFFYIGREWPYKNVKPRIIAEPYMSSKSGELRDYKFFCFDGEPKAFFIASDRHVGNVKFDYFDMEFNHLELRQKYRNSSLVMCKPDKFEEMVRLSRKLSKGLRHVRVDLYETEGRVYFGELTFYHFSGFAPFCPLEWDYTFGEWLRI